MKNISKKIIFLILIFLVTFIWINTKETYASSEEVEELKEVLNEYENDLGDLNQFKEIMNTIYNDLNTATSVDATLKEKLNSDIDKISNIDGINPLIASVLDIEFKSQVENLTDENIGEMKEEFMALKEWADEKAPQQSGNDDVNNKKDDSTTNNVVSDKTTSNSKLPKAGVKNFIGILLLIFICCAIIFKIKNIQLKEIK